MEFHSWLLSSILSSFATDKSPLEVAEVNRTKYGSLHVDSSTDCIASLKLHPKGKVSSINLK